ncbi:ankyrin [Mollisia scopiformis]|uniref:Ankyrin n=1 Tax=Mollisia scopiformis TaxID=149040 RepID=A0A194XUZ7_MOLSC|nr:ankyrin [Mollisia scopiformis]KUJ24033.1 ankyrin [Mollisia scopiformis]
MTRDIATASSALLKPIVNDNSPTNPHRTHSSERKISKMKMFMAWILDLNDEFVHACDREDTITATSLLSRGASVDARRSYGKRGSDTALISACRKGSVPMVIYLLDNGAAIEAQNERRETALQAAFRKNNQAIVELLSERGASMRLILNRISFSTSVPPQPPNLTSLGYSVLYARNSSNPTIRDMAKLVISKGGPSICGSDINNTLDMAFRCLHSVKNRTTRTLEIIELILAVGANINAFKYSSILIEAAKLPDYEPMNPDQDITKLKLLKMFLDHGVGIETRDLTGYTALDHAVMGKSPEAACLLLDAGAVNRYQYWKKHPVPERWDYSDYREVLLYRNICQGYLRYHTKMNASSSSVHSTSQGPTIGRFQRVAPSQPYGPDDFGTTPQSAQEQLP